MKKIKRHTAIVLLLTLAISCVKQNANLQNTKWSYNFEGSSDYFEFKENAKYNYYSCELNELFYGTYTVEGDTINIVQLGSEFDTSFKEGSRHRVPKEKYKLFVKNNTITHLEKWEFKDEKWYKSNFKFDENYIFEKNK